VLNFRVHTEKYLNWSLLVLALILCAGCAKWQGYIGLDANMESEVMVAVQNLIAKTPEPLDPGAPVLVSSVVNIDSLEKSSTFGRYLAELIASNFVNLDYQVKEVKLRRSLFVKQEKGEFLLSRDVHKLTAQYDAQAVVVGTYAIGKHTVHLNIRLIDAESGLVMSSYVTVFPLGSETRSMLLH